MPAVQLIAAAVSGCSVVKLLLALLAVLIASPTRSDAYTATVSSGYELHAAIATPNVTQIFLAANVSMSIDTCPFPTHDMFSATLIDRDLNISSMPAELAAQQQQTAGAVASSSSSNSGPFWWNCNSLSDRFMVLSGRKVTLYNLVLLNCRTYSTVGFFRKAAGAMISLIKVVDDQGSVCLPTATAFGILANQPPASTTAGGTQQRQLLQLAERGSNWCSAAAAAGANSSSNNPGHDFTFQSPLAANSSSPLCQQSAVLMGSVAVTETATNTTNSSAGQPFILQAVNSAVLCPQPVSDACIRDNGTDACLAAAYETVNPDNSANKPCAVTDGYSLHSCLVNPAVHRLLLLQTATMNLTTCPSTEVPGKIDRDLLIFSDPRGPRITWDCGLLSDRVWLQPGKTLTIYHIILANCSTLKPVSIMRLSNGSRVLINDTLVVQPPGLCLPLDQQGGLALHNPRPADVTGVQSLKPGQPNTWCDMNQSTRGDANPPGSNVDWHLDSAAGNASYSEIALLKSTVGLFANTTGFGPAYAATLDEPATVPFYVHPTWPAADSLCRQQALVLSDYAYSDPHGWVEAEASQAPTAAAGNSSTHPSQQQQQQQESGYFGTVTVHYINSAWLCPEPLVEAGCTDPRNATACLAAAYSRADPDKLLLPGAAAYRLAQAQQRASYGVRVVLPAVLASVLGAALLATALLFIVHRQRAKARDKMAAAKGQGLDGPAHHHTPGPFTWLTGGGTSAGSSDPARRLLGIHSTSPLGSQGTGRTPGGGSVASLAHSSPDGIILNMLLGAGSFGRVYQGTWNGSPVAVKIITHSSADDVRISQELALSLSFDHPNLVRALHYTRMTINANSPEASLGAPSQAASTDLFLPEGAVGVFELPSTWAVIRQRNTAGEPGATIDTETWIVMDLMDRGNLANHLRHGKLFMDEQSGGARGALNMPRLLRRAADIAAGVSYLHSRNVCHGDLKCENVLLKSEPQDPDGLMAKVADFGLSRALAFGQSHLSTRRYGTVTHMPPELLVAGKLTPAADVYSFGVMMWEFVTRQLPFAGLHHGEVIHRVVTEDLRPGPWPTPEQRAAMGLPAGYIPLAEACWARQAAARPSMAQVLQRLLDMLSEVEGARDGLV